MMDGERERNMDLLLGVTCEGEWEMETCDGKGSTFCYPVLDRPPCCIRHRRGEKSPHTAYRSRGGEKKSWSRSRVGRGGGEERTVDKTTCEDWERDTGHVEMLLLGQRNQHDRRNNDEGEWGRWQESD